MVANAPRLSLIALTGCRNPYAVTGDVGRCLNDETRYIRRAAVSHSTIEPSQPY